jgi:hypothetical protein
MQKRIPVTRIFHAAALALMLAICVPVAGYAQPTAPPADIQSFFQQVSGEWIGTVEQYTGGVKAETKYFHSVTKQTGPDTYEDVFEYYRIDKVTKAPVQVGITTMTTKITAQGVATNTIVGKGDVFIDPKTLKPESHTLSEVLMMSSDGSLQGTGSGKINVSGLSMDAGKNGKVSHYTSTWVLKNGALNITERLKVSFHVFLFTLPYNIVDNLAAKRGSDVKALMQSAGADLETGPPKH